MFDDATLQQLADGIAAEVVKRLQRHLPFSNEPEAWMDTKAAAEYLDISVTALHKLTSARKLNFSQRVRGAPCFFRRRDLDAYRDQYLVH